MNLLIIPDASQTATTLVREYFLKKKILEKEPKIGKHDVQAVKD